MSTRIKSALLAGAMALVYTGCAHYQGGVADQTTSEYWTDNGPIASPTFRPGMNPRDFRDPNLLIHPITPPATP